MGVDNSGGMLQALSAANRDGRIVYGVCCTWWDTIDKAGKRHFPNGTFPSCPTCPHCSSPLFELASEADWWKSVDEHDAKWPGYRAFIEWTRGKCFKEHMQARAAWEDFKSLRSRVKSD